MFQVEKNQSVLQFRSFPSSNSERNLAFKNILHVAANYVQKKFRFSIINSFWSDNANVRIEGTDLKKNIINRAIQMNWAIIAR